MRRFKTEKIWKGILIGAAYFALSFEVSSASTISRGNVINLVNEERLQAGLDALAENYQLNQAALEKAQDMSRNRYFSHVSPKNVTPWYWFDRAGYNYRYAGENLAIDFSSAEDQHEAWMRSPEHRRNILNPKYQEIGVAVEKEERDGKTVLVTVQLFGARENFQAVLGRSDVRAKLGFFGTLQSSGKKTFDSLSREISRQRENLRAFFLEEQNIGRLQSITLIILFLALMANPLILSFGFFRRAFRSGRLILPKLHFVK